MAPNREEESARLLAWYAALRPLTVDLVGDFAGRELFAIHGESLIKHCLEDAKVDFDSGFQLLHAVYAVERFLSNLSQRGCHFDIIFFSDLKDLCAPEGCSPSNAYKYQLARSILIRHLSNQVPETSDGLRPEVLEFESPEDADFDEYLRTHAVHFFFCHEGDDAPDGAAVTLRHLIHQLISWGKNVAIINSVEWKSSKVFAPLIGRTGEVLESLDLDPTPANAFKVSEAAQVSFDDLDDSIEASSLPDAEASVRAKLSVAICQAIRESTEDDDRAEVDERIRAFLLHTAMLQTCTITERQCSAPDAPQTDKEKEDRGFLREFSEVAHLMIGNEHALLSDKDDVELSGDLYDLVDGRIFFFLLDRLRKGEAFPERVVEVGRALIKAVSAEADADITTLATSQEPKASDSAPRPSVLAFSHPAVDGLIQDLELEQAPEKRDPTANVVFEDLTLWLNATKGAPAEKKPEKLSPWAMKRNQRMERDMVAYSASLTNSRGKTIDPETIVVADKKTQAKQNRPKPAHNQALNGNKGGAGGKKGKKGPQQKGGRQSALDAVKAVQERKAQARSNTIINHWAEMCAEFEKDPSLVGRYLKADKFAYEKSVKGDANALGSEIELYMCNILGKIWHELRSRVPKDGPKGLYLMAMVFNWLQQCAKRPATPAVVTTIEKLVNYLQMPHIPLVAGDQPQNLAFSFDFKAFRPVKEIVADYRALQLEYGGPYMDRRFDSQPDERVRFEPDAWQRRVLDSIDENNSLLVIAPTSAGKTFISFYAMKRVLEQSDEGVLVYVAPTKALVNQIAAEINANFSKKYENQGARSVWAIHTRDYRIHNPTGCQILVTVPDVLQIMLLSPPNASSPTSWSHRIKRIIFDEVHSIGQSEDGVIWEQLLLQAPCPIIALSATVGNPEEFHDWLAKSQSKKGYKMDMVVHGVRYSELRKFIYEPQKELEFGSLKKLQRLPVPGLDEGNTQCENLKFLHPVVALTDRNCDALGDVSFESRDCFTLWNEIKEILSDDEMKKLGIRKPSKALPEIIAKSDVIKWEAELKEALRKGMESGVLDLQKLRRRFESSRPKEVVQNHEETLFSLACDLHAQNALPALVFHFDRIGCETAAQGVLQELSTRENEWKNTDAGWKNTIREYEQWQKEKPKKELEVKIPKRTKDDKGDSVKVSALEVTKAAASVEASQWESFDPDDPLEQFSFADHSKLLPSEFEEMTRKLSWEKLNPWLVEALHRGIGVHHTGMNRRYRQAVEMLFRKGFLRLVVATGTLAMGINMPCKTVVFSGDSVHLTAQNYRQCSGRAGRRGFDLLGNIVFNGIPRERVYEIMSSRLPDLRGQFPISTSLILRLFGLLHGTNNSKYAVQSVDSLLSQTRLYLGGPEDQDAIKHQLRFSIDYLRRQHLLSAKGVPLHFASLVGRLYFTENSVFAFHALLKGGYFHKLCTDIEKNTEKVLQEMMLVLSHIFHRLQAKKTREFVEATQRSLSTVFLPRLPTQAEELLLEHNVETLSVFKGYVNSYISHSLEDEPDRTLPFSKTTVGPEDSDAGRVLDGASTRIRSPFSALSGFTDEFRSTHELCSALRGGVFLEESAIPCIPIWPHDTDVELNAYLYDFFKHGSMDILVRDNRIKESEVWFYLKDFSLTLASIVASLENLVRGTSTEGDEDQIDLQEAGENPAETAQLQRDIALEKSKANSAKPVKKVKAKLNDSWDQDLGDDEEGEGGEEDWEAGSGIRDSERPAWQRQGGGLIKVLDAFVRLRDEFDTKFKKVWA